MISAPEKNTLGESIESDSQISWQPKYARPVAREIPMPCCLRIPTDSRVLSEIPPVELTSVPSTSKKTSFGFETLITFVLTASSESWHGNQQRCLFSAVV